MKRHVNDILVIVILWSYFGGQFSRLDQIESYDFIQVGGFVEATGITETIADKFAFRKLAECNNISK